ncbi:MAG TPA: radical SAM protein [Burkholderiales bacterium]|nr:radical SAM protein [Burkholderiales bacterium]
MTIAAAAIHLKNLLIRLEIGVNRVLRREFIRRDRSLFHIETSGACNLKCRFCAYTKKSTPAVSMASDAFVHTVRQAVELGYSRFELTPCTGDVFMDRTLMRKLDFLEQHPAVTGYEFFTNLTIPKPETVERLAGLRKLKHLTVSVYGHDLETFIAITEGTEKLYTRLMANLEALLRVSGRASYKLAIGLRSTRSRPRRATTDLLRLVERLRENGSEIWLSPGVYNNWGGYISQKDVEGLDMYINSTETTYKYGACEKLFDSVQVTASGVVNACACRDVDATLQIGNIHESRLADIVSPENPRYMAIIEEQQRGEFRPICRSCDFYKSIYHHRSHYRRDRIAVMKLSEFKEQLAARRAKATAAQKVVS